MVLTLSNLYLTLMESLVSISPCRPKTLIILSWWWRGCFPQEPWEQHRATFAAFLIFHHWEVPRGHSGRWGRETAAALQVVLSRHQRKLSGGALWCDHCFRPQRCTKVWRLLLWGAREFNFFTLSILQEKERKFPALHLCTFVSTPGVPRDLLCSV